MVKRLAKLTAWIVVVALIGSVVTLAVTADGRVGSESTTNDGGAWLVNRSESSIGHVNRVVGEISSVAGPFEGAFEVTQAPGVVAVTDRGAGRAILLDTAMSAPGAKVAIAADMTVHAIPDGVIVAESTTGNIWRFDAESFGSLSTVADQPPIMQVAEGAEVTVGLDGRVAAVRPDGSMMWLLGPDESAATLIEIFAPERVDTDGVEVVEDVDEVVAATFVGPSVVFAHGSGRRVVVANGEVTAFDGPEVANLQQPSAGGDNVVSVGPDQGLTTTNLRSGEHREVADARSAVDIRPIVHDGCVWSITRQPTTFHFCGRRAQIGHTSAGLRLMLVNGWVWLNDVELGGIWYVREDDVEVTEISDWSAALQVNDDVETDDDVGGEEEIVTNQNADELAEDVDQLDADGRNTAPVAVDDEDATRRGRPVAVDVLANDTDEDNDPLRIDELTGVDKSGRSAQGAQISISADGAVVQVDPPTDFVGQLRFGYVLHDGRAGHDRAKVVVDVTEPDPATNRPPDTKVDNATVKAGQSVELNVLSNDRDPDGDVLVLTDADARDGAVGYTPDGELQFTPRADSPDGTVEIAYTVQDDFGESADGVARIRVRPADSNQAPQARNDIGATSVGHSVRLNVLDNDIDADGDPLVAQNAQSLGGTEHPVSLSPAGEFLLRPEAPGVYRFSYAVSDGPTTDEAQIQVTVSPRDANQPPIPVVDETVLAVGETRIIRALDNDGDPDGDVIGLVDWVGVDGLEIREVPGIGFSVTATEAAQRRSAFRYWVSDGTSDPVMGTVIVSTLRRAPVDYAPLATVDTVDLRAGVTSRVDVLDNDRDPEGRQLEVATPIATPPEAEVRRSPDGQALLVTVDAEQRYGFQFNYNVADPGGNRSSAVVQVRIVPDDQPNRSPHAVPDTVTTPHGTAVLVHALHNDSDPDGDPITIESIAEQPGHGRVAVNDDGTIRYVPDRGFSGTDRFVYTLVDGYQPPLAANGDPVTDDGPARDRGEVLIGVMPESAENRDPIAVDDSGFAPVAVDTEPVSLNVLGNDTDPDQDSLTVTAVTNVDVGQVAVGRRGHDVVYTPPATGRPRTVAFGYTVSDGRGGAATAHVSLELVPAPEPQPPIAIDDQVGPERARTTVTFDPRGNDRDPDGDTQALEVLVDDPALTVTPEGRLEIAVPPSPTEFTYRVRDEQGLASEPAVISVLVARNAAPKIEPIEVTTEFNQPIEIPIHPAVRDPDKDPLNITLGRQRDGGSVVAADSAPSKLIATFTPDTGFEGEGSFDITVNDGNGHVVTGQVLITVEPPENRPPDVKHGRVTIDAGIDEVFDLATLVTDPDGPARHRFAIVETSGPIDVGRPTRRGVISIGSGVADGGTAGTVQFRLTDGPHEVDGTLDIELATAAFPAPTAATDEARILQGEVTPPIAVLANDIDNSPAGLEGDGLAVTSVGVTDAGSTERQGDQIVFRPNPEFFGTAMFEYTVQDGRRNAAGQSVGTVNVDVVGRPAAPNPPIVQSVGDGYLVVSWAAPPGAVGRAPATGYVLNYVDENGDGDAITFDEPTTSYRLDGLVNAVEYCFTVAAVNEAGIGDGSGAGGPASCGVPDVRPERPAAPTVEFDDSELHVEWSEPLNAGSDIIDYQLRISGGAQTLSPELGVTTRYTWDGLDNGTDYTFEVRARNRATENDGWSDWSPLSAPEHPLTLPDAPEQPTAKRGDRQVRISWTAPDDGGDSIQKYQIRSSVEKGWVDAPAQGTSNNFVWKDIPNGTDVRFEVRAVNRDPASTTPGNISAPSNQVRTCSVPDAPSRPAVSRGDTTIDMSWTVPPDQGCQIEQYVVRVFGPDGDRVATRTASAASTRTTIDGLTNGTEYAVDVAAVNEVVTVDGRAKKWSPRSEPVVPAGPPFATTITSAVNSDVRQVAIAWEPAEPNGRPVEHYEISIDDGPWRGVGNVTEWTHADASMTNGTTYSYRIRAVNAIGPAPASGQASVTTWNVPAAPGVSAAGDQRSIRSTWNTPADNGATVDSIEVRLGTGGCYDAGRSASPSGNSYSWSGLSFDTTYRACVRYHNAVGWGPWGSATASTDPPPRPGARVAKGGRYNNGQCFSQYCRWVVGNGWEFQSGDNIAVRCQSNRLGHWESFGSAYYTEIGSNGNFNLPSGYCIFGYPGNKVRLKIENVRHYGTIYSNTMTW